MNSGVRVCQGDATLAVTDAAGSVDNIVVSRCRQLKDTPRGIP